MPVDPVEVPKAPTDSAPLPKSDTPAPAIKIEKPVNTTGPIDPSKPAGWPRTAVCPVPDKPVSPVTITANGCKTWVVFRTLLGPTRDGPCMPSGSPQLIALYTGNCTWEIHRVQLGKITHYQAQQAVQVQMTQCVPAQVTEKIIKQTPIYWAPTGADTCTTDNLIATVTSPAPAGGCPQYWDRFQNGPLPANVRDAMQTYIDDQGTKDPGLGLIDYPLGPPDPNPPAPTTSPAPPLPQPPSKWDRWWDAWRGWLEIWGFAPQDPSDPHWDEPEQEPLFDPIKPP